MPFTWKCSSDLSWSYASVTGDVDGVDRHRLSCLCVYVHLHLLMYFLFLCIYTLSCMHACMYACMDHACMYVCLCNVMYCTALYCTVWMYKLIINAYTYTYIYILYTLLSTCIHITLDAGSPNPEGDKGRSRQEPFWTPGGPWSKSSKASAALVHGRKIPQLNGGNLRRLGKSMENHHVQNPWKIVAFWLRMGFLSWWSTNPGFRQQLNLAAADSGNSYQHCKMYGVFPRSAKHDALSKWCATIWKWFIQVGVFNVLCHTDFHTQETLHASEIKTYDDMIPWLIEVIHNRHASNMVTASLTCTAAQLLPIKQQYKPSNQFLASKLYIYISLLVSTRSL